MYSETLIFVPFLTHIWRIQNEELVLDQANSKNNCSKKRNFEFSVPIGLKVEKCKIQIARFSIFVTSESKV